MRLALVVEEYYLIGLAQRLLSLSFLLPLLHVRLLKTLTGHAEFPDFLESLELRGKQVSDLVELSLLRQLYRRLPRTIDVPDLRALLDEDPAQLDVSSTGSVVQRRLLGEVILVVYPLFRRVLPHNFDAVVVGSVEHGSLPVAVDIVQAESLAQQYLRTLLLPYIAQVVPSRQM